MKKVSPNSREVKCIKKAEFAPTSALEEELNALDVRIAVIQALIPLGLQAVAEELTDEVTRLTGEKNSRKEGKTPNRRGGTPKRRGGHAQAPGEGRGEGGNSPGGELSAIFL